MRFSLGLFLVGTFFIQQHERLTFGPDSVRFYDGSIPAAALGQNYDGAGGLHALHALGTARIHSRHSRPVFLSRGPWVPIPTALTIVDLLGYT
jgi:hypothetical protein